MPFFHNEFCMFHLIMATRMTNKMALVVKLNENTQQFDVIHVFKENKEKK